MRTREREKERETERVRKGESWREITWRAVWVNVMVLAVETGSSSSFKHGPDLMFEHSDPTINIFLYTCLLICLDQKYCGSVWILWMSFEYPIHFIIQQHLILGGHAYSANYCKCLLSLSFHLMKSKWVILEATRWNLSVYFKFTRHEMQPNTWILFIFSASVFPNKTYLFPQRKCMCSPMNTLLSHKAAT